MNAFYATRKKSPSSKQKILFRIILFFILMGCAEVSLAQDACTSPQRVCDNYTFPGRTSRPSLGRLGCLGDARNPSYFFLEVATGGTANLQETNSNSVDVDYIMLGPYSTLTDMANACSNLSAQPVKACSYSSSAIENINMGTVSAGQLYLLIITNFSNANTNITLTKTSGTATFKCCTLDGTATASCTGTITVNATNTTTGLQYSSDNGQTYQTSNIFTGKAAGTYTVVVKDDSRCLKYISATVPAAIGNNTISPASQSVCATTAAAALTGTAPTGGNGTYTYLWESSTTSATTGFAAASGTNNAAGYSPGTRAVTTWFRRKVTSLDCESFSNVAQVTVFPVPTTANAGPDQTICAATSATLAATPVTSGTGVWSKVSGPAGSAFTNTSDPATTVTGLTTGVYVFRWTSSSGTCTSSTDDVQVTVTATLTAGAVAANQTLCGSGDPAAFTQTTAPMGGTGTFAYQWQSSTDNSTFNNISGATGAIFDAPVISQTTYYRRVVSSAGSNCSDAISNVITVTVNPVLDAGTVGSDQTLCGSGDPAAFTQTAAATGGTGTFTYQWQSSTDNIAFTNISGATGTTYDAPAITQTTYYRRVVSSAGSGCSSVNSNVVKVTVNPVLTAGAIGSNQIFCGNGDPAAFTQTTAAGGGAGTFTYQWQSSTDNITFADISGASGATYDAPSVSQTTYYRRVVSSAGSGCSNAVSNVVTVTVYPVLTAGAVGSDQTFCTSGDPAAFTQTTAAGGGTGTFTYQWQSSTDNTNFTNISGATAATYDAPAITQTTYYRRVVSSAGSGCSSVNSNVVKVTISPTLTAGAIGSNQIFCGSGDPALFTETTAATGGTGTFTYQWQSSTDNTSFTDISGATAATYDAPAITQTTYYRRVVSSAGSACASATSNVITVTLNAVLTPGAVGSNQTFCNSGDPAAFTQTTAPTGGNGTYTYQWQSSTDNTNFTNISGATGATYNAPAITQTTYYRRVVSSAGSGCPDVISNVITVTVDALSVTSNAGPDQSLCDVTQATLAGNNPDPGTGTWTQVSGPVGAAFTNNQDRNTTVTGLTSGVYVFRWTIINGSCAATSDDVQITVGNGSIVANAGPDQNLCSVTQTTLAGNTPAVGTGVWAQESGPAGAVFTNAGSGNTTVTGLTSGVYVFRWTITSGSCGSNTDLVQITIGDGAITANAGVDQSLCDVDQTTLAGNAPSVGTGTWSQVSGPAGATFANANNPLTTVSGLNPGVYVFRWTIVSGSCAAKTDDVQITVGGTAASTSNAGPDQTLCDVNQVTLAGNTPVTGSGVWTQVSGPAGAVITTPGSAGSTVTGIVPGVYVFRWTITTGSCTPNGDNVTITVGNGSITANAGTDQTLCDATEANLSGNAPAVGSGMWSQVSGPAGATFDNAANAATTVNGLTHGVYVFRWTVTSGSCAVKTDDVQITIGDGSTISNAGPDQTLCDVNQVTLAGNTPAIGGGVWTKVSGPAGAVFTNAASATTTVTGLTPGVYVFRWTVISGTCPAVTDDVQITVGDGSITANAGADQTLCDVTQTTLAGNTPAVGTGTWSQVSGPAGAVFTNAGDAGTTVTGLTAGVYVFRWRIVSGTCAAVTDDVQITVGDGSITANAGTDQSLCDATQASLSGNAPAVGSGTWSKVSGPAGATFTNANNAATTVTGLTPGVYIFRWTINSGTCGAKSDDVQITVGDGSITANAGPDQSLCDVTQVSLAANTPAVGSGAWTKISGPAGAVFSDAANPATTVTGLTPGVYVFRWTITSGACAAKTDEVQITIGDGSITANAGTDQSLCDATQASLSANAPAVGSGVWTAVSGPAGATFTNAGNAATTVTGLIPGVYIFRWTITSGSCSAKADDVQVTVGDGSITANAGPDQTLCDVSQVSLSANAPAVGSGVWTQVSGPAGAVIANAGNAATTVTGKVPGVYVFRWTITSGSCSVKTDDVQITVGDGSITAHAGADQSLCDVTQTTLTGNVPAVGSGSWSRISGPAAVITSAGSATTTVTGLTPGVYVFRWTVTSGACGAQSDDIQITVGNGSITANAGADQRLCDVTQTALAGNTPAVGSGVWSQVSGPSTATFTDVNDPLTTISSLSAGVYVFRWTITSGACAARTDDVQITVGDGSIISDAGPDQSLCDVTQASLSANTPAVGSGVWTVVSGPAGAVITTPASASTTVTGLTPGVYVFRWTITSGACGAQADDVMITVGDGSITANAGPDQRLCDVTQATLAGNTPAVGGGTWSQVSGPVTVTFADIRNPQTTASGLTAGVYVFRWSVGSGACGVKTDDVQITVGDGSITANAGADQSLCSVTQATLAANAPAVGSGIWTQISGASGAVFADAANAGTTVSGLAPGIYVFRWTITSGSCANVFDDVQITIGDNNIVANAGPDQQLCDAASVTLDGNTPATGTGTWTQVSGPAGAKITDPSAGHSGVNSLVPGVYVFRWTIRGGSCADKTDDVQITVGTTTIEAAAGPDQLLCDATQATLAGNTPAVGSGVWTQLSGPAGAVFTNAANAATTVTGLTPGVYEFRWTITSGSCGSSSDEVLITVGSAGIVANAGADQSLCDVDRTILSATAPAVGSGTWSQVSGPAVTFSDNRNPATTVDGLNPGVYVFRWTIVSGSCAARTDDVQITVGGTVASTSNAGPDQSLCDVNQVTLAGNTPPTGSGVWTQMSGPAGAVFTNPASATSTVTGIVPGVYVFRWTITTGSCTPNSDDVSITVGDGSITATAGPDQSLCDAIETDLTANRPAVGSGKWTQVSGPAGAGFDNDTAAATAVHDLTPGVYVFRWTITSGSCTLKTDDVQITIGSNSITAAAGTDQQLCDVTQTTLSGNVPAVGSGVWSQISGPAGAAFSNANDAAATVTGLTSGVYVFRWTIKSGACAEESDDVQITVGNGSIAANAGPDQSLCDVVQTTLAGNTPAVGSGSWSQVSGPAGASFTNVNDAGTTVTGLTAGVYIFRWTVISGSCAATSDEVQITVGNGNIIAAAGPDQSLCNAAQTTLAGNAPAVGSGTWTQVSGPAGAAFTNAGDAGTTVTGLTPGVYVFRWTVNSGACGAKTDDVQITIGDDNITANAGTDQSLCDATQTTLSGNVPAVGSGIWSQVSGPAGALFTDASTAGTTVTGLTPGVYVFRWTITSGSCVAKTDDVQITVGDGNITANAGADQNLCDVVQTTLAGNRPAVGSGVWTQVSGPAGAAFTNAGDAGTTVTGLTPGIYVFRWTTISGACGATSDDVQITIGDGSITANAGPDQTLCDVIQTTLAGNAPAVGSGRWTVVSAPARVVFTDATNAGTTVSGLTSGVYVFRWTVTSGACASKSDDVQITIGNGSITSNAGSDQQLCDVTQAALSANTPAVGSGVWTQVSGPAGAAFTNAGAAGTTVTGLTAGVYVFRWTITSGSCPVVSDDVQLTVGNGSITANAGPDQSLCDVVQTTLAANAPAVGRGAWTQIGGPGVAMFADANDPLTSVSGLMPAGVYVFRWTISSGSCPAVMDDVQITVGDGSITANAGADQQLCNATQTSLNGNVPAVGSGKWSQVSGPAGAVFNNADSASTTITGLTPGVYVFRWTITSGTCAVQTDDIQITVGDDNIVSNAGPDQQLCNATTTTLAGNTPPIGSGIWTQVSGPGIATFTDIRNAQTTVSGLAAGIYVFRWTITSGSCADKSDEVQLTIGDSSITASAGPDQRLCSVTQTTLEGNVPSTGNGIWTKVSGPAVNIVNAGSATTTLSGLTPGVYVFRWTITSGSCTAVFDDVQITIGNDNIVAAAGPDQSLCDVVSATLAGNAPTTGTGTWSQVNGPAGAAFTDANNAAATVTGLTTGIYTFRWTIRDGSCSDKSDDVQITVGSTAIVANAGTDQSLCDATQASLTGNDPAVGSGVWSQISGPAGATFTSATSAATTVTGLTPGVYEFRWTITSGACGSSSDDVLVTVGNGSITANAGPDQSLCDVDRTTLAGNVPAVGSGTWTQVSGAGGIIFSDVNDAEAVISGLDPGVYVFRWTISSGACGAKTDEVQITVGNTVATTSNAGPDQTLCDVNQITMAGNVPSIGSGVWTQVSGPAGAVFTNANSGTTTITGLTPGVYEFRWTITTGSCTPNSDDVTITIGNGSTTANAGADQTLCDASEANLAASRPAVGSGRWSQVSGPGGAAFDNDTAAATVVRNLDAGVYVFRWTIISGSCAPKTDDIQITIGAGGITANAGPDQSLCNVTQTTMAGTAPAVGTGTWSQVSGPAGTSITNANDPATTVTGLTPGTYVFRWTIQSGACGIKTDDVQVVVGDNSITANAGPDQQLCNAVRTTLAGNVPATGNGEWEQISGPAGAVFTNAAEAGTAVVGLTPGVYVFRWTINSGACGAKSDEVQVTVGDSTIIANAGTDQTLCDVTQTTLSGNTPAVGSGVWTQLSGPAGAAFTNANNAGTTVTGLTPGVYVFRWTIISGACAATSDEVQITIGNGSITANAGTDQTLCNVTQVVLSGNAPAVGSGVWTQLSGPATVSFTNANDAGTTATGLTPGVYVLRWTITSGACTAKTDDVQLTIGDSSIIASAGADQRLCDVTQVSLTGNKPAVGSGRWTQISGPAATIVQADSAVTSVSGLTPGVYVFRWSITSGTCTVKTDDVQITIGDGSITASAGADQSLCDVTQIALTGNKPAVGSGRWTQITGPTAIITQADSASTTATGLTPGVYVFRWTITSGACTAKTDDVQITIGDSRITADAGADQLLCDVVQTTLTANKPAVGIGRWVQVSGPAATIVRADSAATAVTGLTPGVYVFRWTINSGSCTAQTDDVQVTIGDSRITAAAGADQRLCDASQATLTGNRPAIGSGRWTQVSGPAATITSADSASTTITGLTPGVYVFRWTITSGSCAAQTDEVQITAGDSRITANAGNDQQLCSVTQTTLSANAPAVGSGVWTQISGPAAGITNAGSATTTVSGLTPGVYVFRWTITSGGCTPVTDDVQLTIGDGNISANAGADQTLCDATQITLTGNRPAVGNGRWSQLSGPAAAITSADSAATTVTGLTPGIYVFRWTINSASCVAQTDEVRITIGDGSITASAGADQSLCDVTQTTLTGNSPAVGSGRWTRISGPAAAITNADSTTTTITGLTPGVYVFRWTITSGACAAKTDDVQITVGDGSITASAGADQTLCNVTRTTLTGNRPAVGSGRWSQVNGPANVVIETADSALTIVNGLTPGVYVFRWTITSGGCASKTDEVQITVGDNNIPANAGPDQVLCDVVQTTLAGNTPTDATGRWTQVSGPAGAVFTDASNAATTVTGLTTGVYVFRWTVSSTACGSNSDEVQITINGKPTVANAGPDQTLQNTATATLAGNTPVTGTGRWTQVSGPAGAVIADPANPATRISSLVTGTYVFRWTISTTSCGESADEVSITVSALPVANMEIDKRILTAAPYRTGQRINYQIVITNRGPFTATEVKVNDTLPLGLDALTHLSADRGDVAYDQTNRLITLNVPSVEVNSSITLTYTVLLTAGGNVSNTAYVTSREEDPDPNNNSSEVTATVQGDFFIPNVITPNGDGKNDRFRIPDIHRYPGSILNIYNRWGNQIYQSKNYQNEWAGDGLNEGTYFYILELNTPQGVKKYKGWILIVR